MLETLRTVAPLPLAPQQVSIMLHVEVADIRTILTALVLVGALERKSRGWYQFPPG